MFIRKLAIYCFLFFLTTGIVMAVDYTVPPELPDSDIGLEPGDTLTINAGGVANNNYTISNSGAIFNKSGGVFNNWETLDNNPDGSITNSGVINNCCTFINSGALVNNSDGLLNNDGEFTNNGSFTNMGTLTSNDWSNLDNLGTITNMTGGNIVINSGGAITNDGTLTNSGVITVNEDGGLNNWRAITNNSEGTITNRGYLVNSGDITNNGVITSSGTIYNYDSGTLTNSGTLHNSGSIRNEAVIVNASGGILTNSGTITNTSAGTITNSGMIINESGATITNRGIFTNNGTITIEPNSVFSQRPSGTYSGSGSIVLGGRLNNFSNNAFPIAALNFTGGTFNNDGTGPVSISTVLVGSGNIGSIQGTAPIELAIANVDGALNINNVISGGAPLTKTGSGTLTLTGINTYTGGTNVNNGIVCVSSDNNLGNASGGLTFSGGTLQTTSSFSINRLITLNAGGGNFDTNGNSLTLAGNISGSGSLTKTGSGALTLSGVNTYSGGTNINAGILSGNTASIQGSIANNGQVIFNQGTDGIYSSAMTGVGSLTKNGAGTLTLSGANTYSGGTIVNAGILSGNTAGLQGAITNNGQVIFNQNSDGIYIGAMTGAGTLTKTGSGALTLSGVNTYTGQTTINAGSLAVNGSITSPVTIGATGILEGAGTITGNVTNNGIISPGNSIGITTIIGNYTQNAGSVYIVEVNPSGQSDKPVITGTAVLNGGTAWVFLFKKGAYATGTKYTILTAGSVTGAFADVASNLVFLTPSLQYDTRNVYLLLSRNARNFIDTAVTPNQQAVASALDRAAPSATGDMLTIVNNLHGLTSFESRSAYNQMGGISHTALAGTTFSSFNRYIGTISERMEGFIAGGPVPAYAGRLLFASRSDAASDAGNAVLALASMRTDGGRIPEWGFWAKGYGSMGERRGDDISSEYNYNTTGVTAGFDRQAKSNFLIGISAGYSAAKVNMKDLSYTGNVTSYQASFYGSYFPDPWYINGIVAYGHNRYDTTRGISFGGITRTANALYEGYTVSGCTEAGYRLRKDAISIIPMVSLQAGYLARDGFTETDAGALNLNADKDRTASLLGSMGVRLRKDFETASGTITPELKIRWLHEFSRSDNMVNASFAGSPASAFTVQGDKSNRDSVAIGFGLTHTAGNNVSLFLVYDANLAADRTEQGGSMGIRYRW
jgi:outer membrane autotransporter protein